MPPEYDNLIAKVMVHARRSRRGDRPPAAGPRRDRDRRHPDDAAVPPVRRRGPGLPARRAVDGLGRGALGRAGRSRARPRGWPRSRPALGRGLATSATAPMANRRGHGAGADRRTRGRPGERRAPLAAGRPSKRRRTDGRGSASRLGRTAPSGQLPRRRRRQCAVDASSSSRRRTAAGRVDVAPEAATAGRVDGPPRLRLATPAAPRCPHHGRCAPATRRRAGRRSASRSSSTAGGSRSTSSRRRAPRLRERATSARAAARRRRARRSSVRSSRGASCRSTSPRATPSRPAGACSSSRR